MSEQKGPAEEPLMDRLQRLERQCRVLQVILFSMFLIGAWVIVETTGRRSTIVADRFLLRNDVGEHRAELSLNHTGDPELKFYDRQGRDQIVLSTVGDQFAYLHLLNEGELRAALIAQDEGTAALRFFDRESRIVSSLPDFNTVVLPAASLLETDAMSLGPDSMEGVTPMQPRLGQTRQRFIDIEADSQANLDLDSVCIPS
ncbi:hypothetical protein BH23PLA1_BH23PLA1_12870 [soil metagenome]